MPLLLVAGILHSGDLNMFFPHVKFFFQYNIPMTIQIRPAVPADCPGLGKVQLDSWQTTPGAEIKPPSYWARFSYVQRESAWRELLASDRPLAVFSALTASGEIVGFAWCEGAGGAFPDYQVELSAMHLLPPFRRQGLGTRLFGRIWQAAQAHGARSLMLWTGRDNHPARAFYEKLGGRRLGEQTQDLDGVAFTEIAYGWPDLENPPHTDLFYSPF